MGCNRAGGDRLDLDRLWGGTPPDGLTLSVLAWLLLPGVIFLLGWAKPWAGLLAAGAGLAALALAPGWRGNGRAERCCLASAADRHDSPPRTGNGLPTGWRLTLLCLTLGLLWAAGTGTHHLVYSTADWQVRDAVLRDLALIPWPVGYAAALHGADALLRAPLGFFLPAGLFGRLAGIEAAQIALWAWAGLGLALLLGLLAGLARDLAPTRAGRAFAVMVPVFVLFHGLDILPNAWLDWQAGAGLLGSWNRGGEWWARLFQYAGHVTELLWAPNHAIAAWLTALLLLRHGRHPDLPRMLALPLAATAFWSPVGTIGAAVLAMVAVLEQGWEAVLAAARAPGNWLAAVFALPLCLYLLAGAETVRHQPLLSAWPVGLALSRWALFLVLEVLAWAVPLALLLRARLLTAAVAVLCLLPAYVFGPGNEMTSRGGIAPLAVLAVAAAAGLLAPVRNARQRWARRTLMACSVLAVLGAVMEGSLLIARPAWPASPACSVPEAGQQSVFQDSTDWSHYLAPWPEATLVPWLRPPLLQVPPPSDEGLRCWPRGGA